MKGLEQLLFDCRCMNASPRAAFTVVGTIGAFIHEAHRKRGSAPGSCPVSKRCPQMGLKAE